MPFVKNEMVAIAVVRGGVVIAVQEDAISFDHTETGNGTLDPVAVSSVIWSGQNVSAFFQFPVSIPEGVGTIRPRRPTEPEVTANLALYTNMWTTGGDVVVTFNHALGTDTITIRLRTLTTIDILALRGADSTIAALPITGGTPVLPAGFDSYQWTLGGGLPGFSISAPSPGTSALFTQDDSGTWGTTGPQNWTLTIRTRRGVASDPQLDSVATFSGAFAGQQPTLTLRQPQASDDGGGTLTPYAAAGPRAGYSYFQNQTGTGRGLNSALPAGTATRRGLVSGNQVATFDDELRLTPTLPALVSNVPFGTTGAMTIEVAYADSRYPTVTCQASISTRRLDDTAAPAFSILIPNPSGAVTLRVETGAEAYDWLAVSETLAAANVTPPPLPALGVATLAVTFGNLVVGGETGNVVVDLRRSGAGNVRSNGGTVSAEVAAPLPAINVTPTPLPGGRARMLYETTLTASTTAGAGQELFWQVISPAQLAFPTSVNAGPTNQLRALVHLLDAWGGTNVNVTVRVTKQPTGGGAPIEGGNDVVLQLPVAASKDPVNTAIVLDRSGSMAILSAGASRWFKAVSGAHFMAQQIAAENATRAAGTKHNVAILWFGGWDTVADNYSAPSTDPFGEGNFGVLTVGGNALDFSDPDAAAGFLTNLDTAKDALEALTQPKFWTAIGAGLLWGREKLRAADVAYNRERILICLSDGEENRPPLVADATVPPRWHQLQDGTNIGDAGVRIYAAAVATTTAAANTLRTAVTNTGGIAALDVKEVPDAGSLIQQWFARTFSSLFGFNTIVAGYDPTLSSGETAAHVVKVTQAHTRLVVTLFLDAPSIDHWSVTLEPPGGGEITEADAGALPDIELRTGPLYKSFVVSLPLSIPGHEHRWAGDWVFRVTRTGDASGTYIVNAIAKSDIDAEMRVIGPASPAPGDVVKLRVDVTHGGGKPIDGAVVRSVITPPGVWRDGLVAAAASSTPTAAGGDNGIAWQNATQALAVGGMFVDGTPMTLDLVGVGGGGYEATLPLTVPGGWQIDTTIEGVRPIKQRFPFDVIVRNISRYYLVPEAARFEISVAALSLKPLQPFSLEERETLAVRFVPNAENTVRGGLALGEVLRFWVRPKDISDLLLGPGHATQIAFEHPDFPRRRWRAVDMGDGTYGATIRFVSRLPPIIDRHFGKLIAEGLLYADPLTNTNRPRFTQTFPLKGWIVRVLGVVMPLDIGFKLQPWVKERHALLPPRYSVSIGTAIAAADAVKSKKLKDEEAKALKLLDGVFEKIVGMPYVPTPTMARWIGNSIGHVASAIDDALPALHDTHLGEALRALAIAYESGRDRVRELERDACSDKTVFETWDDLRAATDAFRRSAAVGARASERPTSD